MSRGGGPGPTPLPGPTPEHLLQQRPSGFRGHGPSRFVSFRPRLRSCSRGALSVMTDTTRGGHGDVTARTQPPCSHQGQRGPTGRRGGGGGRGAVAHRPVLALPGGRSAGTGGLPQRSRLAPVSPGHPPRRGTTGRRRAPAPPVAPGGRPARCEARGLRGAEGAPGAAGSGVRAAPRGRGTPGPEGGSERRAGPPRPAPSGPSAAPNRSALPP